MVVSFLSKIGGKFISLAKKSPKLTVKTEQELSRKSSTELTEYAQFMKGYFDRYRDIDKEIYMPGDRKSMGYIRTMWDNYKPKTFYEKIWNTASPATYSTYKLWKLPKKEHEKLNSVIDSATAACMVIPGAQELDIPLGVLSGVSHVMYGLKTDHQNSGKHVASGLAKIVDSTKDLPEFKDVHRQAKSFLEKSMLNFNPEKELA